MSDVQIFRSIEFVSLIGLDGCFAQGVGHGLPRPHAAAA